jgi:hypothetical protein
LSGRYCAKRTLNPARKSATRGLDTTSARWSAAGPPGAQPASCQIQKESEEEQPHNMHGFMVAQNSTRYQ